MNQLAKYGGALFAFLLSMVILYFIAIWIIPLIWTSVIKTVKLLFVFLMKMRS